MREVEKDPEAVARGDEPLAVVREAVADVGRGRETERHPVGEGVRPCPDDPERSEPAPVEGFEILEVRLDRLGAFEVQDRGGWATVEGCLEVG